MIENLPVSTTISRITDSFKVFGNILHVKVSTRSSEVLAYVCFEKESSLKAALRAKNRTVFDGNIIIVDTFPSGIYDETYSLRDDLLDKIVIINGVHRRKVDGARKKRADGKGNSGEGPSDVR